MVSTLKMRLTGSRQVSWDHLPLLETLSLDLWFQLLWDLLQQPSRPQGQPWGIFLWIAVAVAYDIFRWKQLEFAYKEGTNLINNMQSTLTALIEAASVLGIFMVGALIATMINVDVTWMPHIGDKAIDIQDMLNLIFPRLVPAIITGVIYWLLGRKGMNSTKAILLIIVAAIAFSAFGHFCFGMQ